MQARGKGVQSPKNFVDILYELPPFMKFHDRILPEAFRKLLASHATQRWGQEIQEGVYDMLEIFIDLVVTRLNAEEKLSKGPTSIYDFLNRQNHRFTMRSIWSYSRLVLLRLSESNQSSYIRDVPWLEGCNCRRNCSYLLHD